MVTPILMSSSASKNETFGFAGRTKRGQSAIKRVK